MTRSHTGLQAFLLIARLAFGVVFVWAAHGKILDPDQFSQQIANYQIIGPASSALVGAVLPWTEFLVGCCLLLSVWNSGAWTVATFLCGCFVAAKAWVLHRGLSVDCGCGIIDEKVTPTSLALAIGLLALCACSNVAWILQTRRVGKRSDSQHGKNQQLPADATLPAMPMKPIIAALSIIIYSWIPAARAVDPSTLTIPDLRRSGCIQLQAEFDRMLTAHSKDPNFAAITDRLINLDDATASVLHDLRIHHAAFLSQSLATVGGSDSGNQDKAKLLGAAKIVESFRANFAKPVAPKSWNELDRGIVEKYLHASSDTLTKYLQSRAHGCMSVMGVDGPEIERLAFVLPMLTAAQDQNLAGPPPALPNWMTHRADIQNLQEFAAESSYPRVAFALASLDSSATTAPIDPSVAYVAFAKQEADAMSRTGKYPAALGCLRDGFTVATAAKHNADAAELSFHIAELLDTTDSADAAAQEMKLSQSLSNDETQYGRASMLRLKYLYEANHYDLLATEAQADLKEPRCQVYLPQIMYIAWVGCRRQEGADADFWRKSFLESFPDNPLAADMYFAAAMDALSASNYDEASRLLQFIEYRFPQCKIIDKVHEIQSRLAADGSNHESATASAKLAGAGAGK